MLQTNSGLKFRFQHRVPLVLELTEEVETGTVTRTFEREGTAVEVELPDTSAGVTELAGFSVVHPNDQYDRAAGRRQALANALTGLPRDIRREVWSEYWALRGRVGNA